MATEQDFRLQPRSDELSTVLCNHCGNAIGEVHVAQQTPTGRDTGRNQAEVTVDARQIADEHLAECDQRPQAADRPDYGKETPKRPPESAPVDKNREL